MGSRPTPVGRFCAKTAQQGLGSYPGIYFIHGYWSKNPFVAEGSACRGEPFFFFSVSLTNLTLSNDGCHVASNLTLPKGNARFHHHGSVRIS